MGRDGSKALRLGFNLGCVYCLTSGSITRCYLIPLVCLRLFKVLLIEDTLHYM
uniref:Uncharacterized protein n=1 Tax=Helianthus annuus TaxID=4232 RepID=A0A251VAU5_HELAN